MNSMDEALEALRRDAGPEIDSLTHAEARGLLAPQSLGNIGVELYDDSEIHLASVT